MSDDGLPLKYRPDTFEKVVGQDVLVRFTSELIRRGKVGKNLIIYGGWGSGKTTTARIYSRALNCTNVSESGSPCLVCENCQLFEAKQFPDYMEFDGSSKGSIAQIKEIVDVAKMPPMLGSKRIMVVDEAQGVSRQGFDAMLKLVEEPPPHLVLIFLTTEVDKIRPAIKSRCQALEVKLLESRVAARYLKQVCEWEGYKYDDAAIELIVFTSKGHPRDLLKNLEQVSTLGDITLDNAKDAFSIGFIQNLVSFGRAVFSADVTQTVKSLRDWADAPGHKIDVLREFFLYLYYNRVLNLRLEVNPVFDLIPAGDLADIVLKAKNVASQGHHTLEEAWPTINKFWGSVSARTDTGVELEALNFYHLVNTNRFHLDRVGTPLPVDTGPKKDQAKRQTTRGRQFVTQPEELQTPAAPVAQASTITTVAAPAPTVAPNPAEPAPKIYPHTLLLHGFKPQAKADVRIDEPSVQLPPVTPKAPVASAAPEPVPATPLETPVVPAAISNNPWGVTPEALPIGSALPTKVYDFSGSVDDIDLMD